MSMRQIIVLGVALMAAVAALFLVRGMATKPTPEITPMPEPPVPKPEPKPEPAKPEPKKWKLW